MAAPVGKSRWWGAPFYVYLACLILLCTLVVLQSFGLTSGRPTLRAYWEVFSTPVYWMVFRNTLVIAGLNATVTVALSVLGALLVSKAPPRYRNVLLFVGMIPLLTPTIVRTFGWVMALQSGGSLSWLTGGRVPFDRILYSRTGLLVGLAHAFYPVGFFYIWTSLRGLDRRQIETAAMLGASSARVFWHIVLPQLLPSVMAVWVFVFLLTTGAFVTPEILGGTGDVMVYRVIETRLHTFLDATLAASYAVVIVCALIPLLWVSERAFNISHMLGGGVDRHV